MSILLPADRPNCSTDSLASLPKPDDASVNVSDEVKIFLLE